MYNSGIELCCTPVEIERSRLRDIIVGATSQVSPEPIMIRFGINTNLEIADRKLFDEYLADITHRIIFGYFNQAYQKLHRTKTLNFDSYFVNKEVGTFGYYSHRFEEKGPKFVINVVCKSHEHSNAPDYSVSVVLMGMPWDTLLYRSVPKLVQKDFPQQLKMWWSLKDLAPDNQF